MKLSATKITVLLVVVFVVYAFVSTSWIERDEDAPSMSEAESKQNNLFIRSYEAISDINAKVDVWRERKSVSCIYYIFLTRVRQTVTPIPGERICFRLNADYQVNDFPSLNGIFYHDLGNNEKAQREFNIKPLFDRRVIVGKITVKDP